MGINIFSSCYTNPEARAPNPSDFKIIECHKVNSLYVSKINYAGVTNYEGNKILITKFDPMKVQKLDPHFSPNGGVLARFEPTETGWNYAIGLAILIDN